MVWLVMAWGALCCVGFVFWWAMGKAAKRGDRQLGIEE